MKRKTGFPPHIDPDRLPKGVYFNKRDKRWIYRRQVNGQRKEIRLGDHALTMGDLHKAVEDILSGPTTSFRSISLRFMASSEFAKLKPRTKRGYRAIHDFVCERRTKAGSKLGDVNIAAWTVGAVRKYREARRVESESGAASDLRYIKRVFSWAVEYEYMPTNPAKEISLRGLSSARRYYIEDADFYGALNLAPIKLALIMYFAYLTGRRRTDILEATRRNLLPEGIYFPESKTDKESLVPWTEHVRQTVDLIKEVCGDSIYLFPSNGRPDRRFSDSAITNAMSALTRKLRKAGLKPFQFKDIRKKYGTDLEEQGGDAQKSLMHASRSTTDRHYTSKPTKVVPIR